MFMDYDRKLIIVSTQKQHVFGPVRYYYVV